MKRKQLERLCGEAGAVASDAIDMLLRSKKTKKAACELISRMNEIDLQWRDTCCGLHLRHVNGKKQD